MKIKNKFGRKLHELLTPAKKFCESYGNIYGEVEDDLFDSVKQRNNTFTFLVSVYYEESTKENKFILSQFIAGNAILCTKVFKGLFDSDDKEHKIISEAIIKAYKESVIFNK
jgi:hypothetical protein